MAHGNAFPTRRAMMHKKRQSDESSAPNDPVESSLITTGQPTASRNAKTAELPSRTAQATGDWAQTAGLERTTVEPSSSPTRVAASTNAADAEGGWESLSDGAHLGIYIAAAVVGALILGIAGFFVYRHKRQTREAKFHTKTQGLRESFISSGAEVQNEKMQHAESPASPASVPPSYHTDGAYGAYAPRPQRSYAAYAGSDDTRSARSYAAYAGGGGGADDAASMYSASIRAPQSARLPPQPQAQPSFAVTNPYGGVEDAYVEDHAQPALHYNQLSRSQSPHGMTQMPQQPPVVAVTAASPPAPTGFAWEQPYTGPSHGQWR